MPDTTHLPTATDDELASLKRDGFFIREQLFTEAEIAGLEQLGDDAVKFFDDRVKDHHISKKGRITFVNSGADDSPSKEGLLAFSVQPKIASMARSIAGPDAAHFAYQLVYKHPHNPDAFPWHQDDSYTNSNTGYFTIWLAISDVTIANGCICVLPGKSLDALLPYEMSELGRTCWPLDDPDQGVPVELKRGDAVVFTSKMVHCSGGNSTDGYRKGLIMAFIDANAVSTQSGQPYNTVAYPES